MVASTPAAPSVPPSRGDRLSLTDYWQQEAIAEQRHEYHDGIRVAMAGGSEAHSKIAVNLVAFLHFALRETDWQVYNSDLRVWIPDYRCCTYTDGMVVWGEPEFHGDRNDEILNPGLIVEVLSPSTERYDRGEKFRKYRSLPSFQDYLLVSADEPYIEHYCKTDAAAWTFTSYGEINAAIWLNNLQLSIPLAEIYRRVNFPIP
jgi:Uma2 family endonuclease